MPTQKSHLHVFLAAGKTTVSFTQHLEDARANEKDTMVTFECETSEPFIKVKWLKNGSEIFSGDKYRMHSDRKVHFLSVLIIDMKDDAEYTCVIADDESLGTSAHLHVEGKPHNFCSSSVFSVLGWTLRVHGSSVGLCRCCLGAG